MSDRSLFQRLKERKLVQWALAYFAGAFVVLQLLDALETPLGLAATVQQGILVVVGIGFFITLIIAWYHGEKGRQRVSWPELLMVGALLVVAGVAISVLGGGGEGSDSPPVLLPASTEDDRPSIAVLLCDNFSPNPEDAFRAHGIHEEILLRLQGISSIRSIGRTSVLQFAEDPSPVDEIAHSLGVGFVGECSVLKDPEASQIRVTFQLLDASGTQQWADSYDRDLTVANIYDIQSEIAQRVAGSVGAALLPEEEDRIASPPTENTEAYNAFNLGRSYMREGVSEDDFRRAIRFFEIALEEDSMYAPAHSSLGEAYAGLAMGNIDPPDATWPVARDAATKALGIDETLTAAHRVLALEKMFYEYDWESAESTYLRSLEINPDQADTRLYYSWLLAVLQRTDEGVAQVSEARRLEPNSLWVDLHSCWAFMMLDQLDEAQALAERMLESDPPFPLANLCLAQTLLEKGEYATALPPLHAATIAMGEDIADELAWLSMTYGFLGREDEAREYADRLEQIAEEGRLVSPVNRAWVSIGFGDTDRAIQLLEAGFQRRDPYMFFTAKMRFLSSGLGDDPRFRALRKEMGLE